MTYNLPKDEFVQELHRLEGTPKEVLEHPELMELIIPLLRADFRLTETCEYVTDIRLGCPITAYGGLQGEESTRDRLLPWKEQTSSGFGLHMLPGGHFFLRSSQKLLLALLARDLQNAIAGRRISDQQNS